jgi:hypothetical protein
MAFRLGAIAVGLQSADILIRIGILFAQIIGMAMAAANPHAPPAFLNQNFKLWKLTHDQHWGLFIGTPISWSAAIAAYLLIARWRDGSWNRRAILLAMMNTFDLYLWAAQNAKLLGLGVPTIDNSWVAYSVSVLQWFELMIFGSLAADVAVHLGRSDAARKEQKSRSFAMVGLGFWSLVLLIGTHLRPAGLPRFHLPPIREAFFLMLMSEITLALTAFQVMVLCLLASRDCGQILQELRKDDHEHALLKPQADHGFE